MSYFDAFECRTLIRLVYKSLVFWYWSCIQVSFFEPAYVFECCIMIGSLNLIGAMFCCDVGHFRRICKGQGSALLCYTCATLMGVMHLCVLLHMCALSGQGSRQLVSAKALFPVGTHTIAGLRVFALNFAKTFPWFVKLCVCPTVSTL